MDIKSFVEKHIPQMDGPEKVYELFKNLGYKTLDVSYKGISAWNLREKDKEVVKTIYSISNYDSNFQILLVELKTNNLQAIKDLSLHLERLIQYPLIVFTSDYRNYTFLIIEKIRESAGVWKRKIIRLTFDRENAYYTDKMIISELINKNEQIEPANLYNAVRESLNVKKVSEEFFSEYKAILMKIRTFVSSQGINIKEAHEFSQQLLNRIMFVYFIEKKGWLIKSPRFMKWYWETFSSYSKSSQTKDTFYSHWLDALFFEAFNNSFSHPAYLPQEVKTILSQAPFLNGGLFKKNDLDRLSIHIPDDFFKSILNFFEKYNFTIREDLPLDVEVAIDPQMIGYVYESLANVAEEIYVRQDLGIFYTPKVEVDFMCRRSLLEYLDKNTAIAKKILYHLLFSEDKTEVETRLTNDDYTKLEYALDNLAVLDPACGSGAFLVGMMNVLVEMYKFIFKHLKREMSDFELKKRIIGRNLYGVDVMRWAVHSAELRLWLSLMIESDLSLCDLRMNPLLPNLNLKLRVGDSLVQEIGGLNLKIRDGEISLPIKRRLADLKNEKEKFYNNDRTGKFKTEKSILNEEVSIFNDIIEERIIKLQKEKQYLSLPKLKTGNMYSDISSYKVADDTDKDRVKRLKEIDDQINDLNLIRVKLKEQKPFVWDIDFAEIFGEKGGFDIVIGNPPYVRQEKIAPPNVVKSEVTLEEKREYKEKLISSVKNQFDKVPNIDRKSDYYLYFYFHGLSLINKKGTFCFITSNSWLDVGYGASLQEFLLKYVPIIAIYDNQSTRSFEHADVNTIIALFGAPIKAKGDFPALSNVAKFVVFKKPFEEAINTKTLLEIEEAKEILTSDSFRVFPKKQEDLLEEGWEYPEPEVVTSSGLSKTLPKSHPEIVSKPTSLLKQKFLTGYYAGNKWGGKYLRAPDIFFKILEKGKGKLVKLGDIAEVRRGFTTGANEFFYLTPTGKPAPEGLMHVKNGAGWEGFIEEEYLKPVIKSPRELKTIVVKLEDLKYKVFMCNKTKQELAGTYALKYIQWGEEQGYQYRPTCASRNRWWDLGEWEVSKNILPMFENERKYCFFNSANAFIDAALYWVYEKNNIYDINLNIILNSSIIGFYKELLCRPPEGLGVLQMKVYHYNEILIPSLECCRFMIDNSILIKSFYGREIKTIFEEIGLNLCKERGCQHVEHPYEYINPSEVSLDKVMPDRRELDKIVFEALGLTDEEQLEVYRAVVELVKNRLVKARSV